jgi:MoaA/NifB/PqqE/SkfB family radical SAM enzyme
VQAGAERVPDVMIAGTDQASAVTSSQPKGIICIRPFYEFEIDITGNVVVCCTAWLKHSLGNMKKQTIAEIWNGQVAKHIRRKMYRGEWEDICNASCPTIVEYKKFGTMVLFDELHRNENLTPKHVEEILAGKVALESTPTLFKLSDSKVCNLACKMCGVVLSESLVDDKGMIQKRTDDLKQYLDRAKIILMCGNGDPFARKDTRELLMNYQGGNPDLQFALVTNGLLLPRFWDKVKHQKFESINISVDAPVKDVYEKIRTGGKWDDILKALDLVRVNRDKFKSIVVSMVVMRSNYRLIPAFIDFVESYGFMPLFSRIHGMFGDENIFELDDRAALAELRSILSSERQKQRPVNVVWQDLIEYAD